MAALLPRVVCGQAALHGRRPRAGSVRTLAAAAEPASLAASAWAGVRVAYQVCPSVPNAQRSLTAAQGVPGAYSEQAALLAYAGATAAPFDQFELAFEARSSRLSLWRTNNVRARLRLWSSSLSSEQCCPSRIRSGCEQILVHNASHLYSTAGKHPPELRLAAASPPAHRRRGARFFSLTRSNTRISC